MERITGLKTQNFECYELINDWNKLKDLSLFKQLQFIFFKQRFKRYVQTKNYKEILDVKEDSGKWTMTVQSLTSGTIKIIGQ